MAYDYAGDWGTGVTTAEHQANLELSSSNPTSTVSSTKLAIESYLEAGVSANKIVLGMTLYGRVFANTDGPGKPSQGVAVESGVYDYKALPQPGASVTNDLHIAASYSHDAGKRLMISYDTPG
jgi:chitinase